MNTKTPIKIVALAALTVLIIPALALAQTPDVMSASYQWSAPTTGSTVVQYVVQHEIDGGNWVTVGTTDTNSYTLDLTVGQSHRIRVAGLDAQNRQGPWSVASDPYSPDPGAPGQPGKPILF